MPSFRVIDIAALWLAARLSARCRLREAIGSGHNHGSGPRLARQ
jgi:hypothetical protein